MRELYQQIDTLRDISLIRLGDENYLVIACDSAGGIGPKKGDSLRVPGQVVGRFTTRVALMEVMAVGARPVNVINTLAVEYEPTGKEIITGIRAEVNKAGLDPDIVINGSTEENIPTFQTGIGVTVIGLVEASGLRLARSSPLDMVVAVGLPMVGEEVLAKEELIADLSTLQGLLQLDFIHEILPVGSKGISYEAGILAKMSGFKLDFNPELKIDPEKSAGPGTVLLASLPADKIEEVSRFISKPVNMVGRLITKRE
ncbi:MAG: hypothetical protein PWR10_1147 [Halanaerobiales bacterium]|nr:hypothetical protein [Halanaerobiales bacterium]